MLHMLDGWYTWLLERIAMSQPAEKQPVRRLGMGTAAAILGVLVFSGLIGIITSFVHTGNISVVYVVLIILLAILFGRGSAILASLLAFLAYDFFFIPPVHLLTVDDPVEWFSLSALLLTGVVVGQLTAEVRHRELAAVASEQQTALLYSLAQDVAAESDRERLLPMLADRLIAVFSPEGVTAALIWLADEDEQLQLRAIAHASAISAWHGPLALRTGTALPVQLHQMDTPEHQAQAERAFRERRITALIDPTGLEAHLTCFVPLSSSGHVVGVLGLAGMTSVIGLLTQVHMPAPDLTIPAPTRARKAPLFAAFCEQYALALERTTLQQEAIHVAALRESDRLKTALLGSVTHDLRTPIAAIQAAASSLEQTDVAWTANERAELLQTISTGATRLARLVDNLLALSRLEAGVAPLIKTPYPINDVIATVLDELEISGATVGRPVSVDIAEDPLEVPMDHAQIERVMTNLVENAAKYSPPGSAIALRAWRAGDAICVAVTDHGIGIPPEEQEKIFDRFYRFQQPLPWARVLPPQGTGLGLAICAGIVHEHGGRIWVESTPGQGSTFLFSLPLAVGAGTAPEPAMTGGHA